MSVTSTSTLSVQVLDFEEICLLIQRVRLICASCSSDQRFACGFLQIPPRGGHPCRPANDSPCRGHRRLSLPSDCALPGAQIQSPSVTSGFCSGIWEGSLVYGASRLPGFFARLFVENHPLNVLDRSNSLFQEFHCANFECLQTVLQCTCSQRVFIDEITRL